MKYELTTAQLDKLLKPYWDGKFENTKKGKVENYSENDDWTGIFMNTPDGWNLIAGHRSDDVGDTWYSNGKYFNGGWQFYNINTDEFNESMKRYINHRFGEDIWNIR
jgi:hypothetical protein